MITLNGNDFAANDQEFIDSLFKDSGSCVGFYRVYKNTVSLLDMQKNKVGVITKHKVLALATKLDNGQWWYSHGDIPLVGEYLSVSDKYKDIDTVLNKTINK